MNETIDPPSAKFHMSLAVSNLARSVAFYRVLFDSAPAKQFDDYAKFELEDPPVVFSITPHPVGPAGGPLSHAGFKLPDAEAVERLKLRLEEAGYPVQCQQGAVCGYRRLDKLHVADPNGTQWEAYVVESEVAPESILRGADGPVAVETPVDAPLVWEHFVTNPMHGGIPHGDGTLDEVRLVGTFNGTLNHEQQRGIVQEAFRKLKPGGKVLVHGLMADRPFPGACPPLPGLAAMVSQVPVQTAVLAELSRGGFVGMHVTRYADKPWIRHDRVELREVKIAGVRPIAAADRRRVLYKGPFAEAVDDFGNVFPRGERREVSDAAWNLLRSGPASESFLFLDVPGGGGSDVCDLRF